MVGSTSYFFPWTNYLLILLSYTYRNVNTHIQDNGIFCCFFFLSFLPTSTLGLCCHYISIHIYINIFPWTIFLWFSRALSLISTRCFIHLTLCQTKLGFVHTAALIFNNFCKYLSPEVSALGNGYRVSLEGHYFCVLSSILLWSHFTVVLYQTKLSLVKYLKLGIWR